MPAPIRLHPENPHYFLFRDRPTILIGSAEHYGALINGDFDYARYFDALAAEGFNHSRLFSGSYREIPGRTFNIDENTLAPGEGAFRAPWARIAAPAGEPGAELFDLGRMDPAYFSRLKDIVSYAGERGIVVEVALFCHFYSDELWKMSPLCSSSNVNGIGARGRKGAYDMREPALLEVQERLTVEIVRALSDFDNVYYELMNEPYMDEACKSHSAFQDRIARLIADTEAGLPHRHLIARGMRNHAELLRERPPYTDVLNFHYALPLAALANHRLDIAIADDETGFKGQTMAPYRREAWSFILAGGGVFSHLDYSFTCAHPGGTFRPPPHTPGIGGPEWRRQLAVLREFIAGFDFISMRPAIELNAQRIQDRLASLILANPGKEYAVYLDAPPAREEGGARYGMLLEPGTYRLTWLLPADGSILAEETVEWEGGFRETGLPDFPEDLAGRILRVG